jgi:hypothetical protein
MTATLSASLFCPCGHRLHYPSPPTHTYMVRQVHHFGLTVTVPTADGTWRIPRHFLALHGRFRPWEIAGLALSFGWRRLYRPRGFARG